MSTDEYDYSIKLVISGDSGVGKTKLITRYVNDYFEEASNPTIGLDFAIKETMVTGQKVKCQIWDTAGQEKLKAIASAYYKNSQGVILVFDISSKASFEHIPRWLEEIKSNIESDVPVILVGNKADLISERQVSIVEAKSFSEENNFFYMEVSAKENKDDCVTLAFDNLVAQIITILETKNQKNGSKVNKGKNLNDLNSGNANEDRQNDAKGKCCK